MASNAWISSLSDSDDSLPSCSQYLHSQKHQDTEVDGYKSLMQRLGKPSEPINLITSTHAKENGFSDNEKTNPSIVKSSKQPKRRKKQKVSATPNENDKENDKQMKFFKPEELYEKLTCTLSYSVLELFSSKDIMSTIKDNLPIHCDFIHETNPVVNWFLDIPDCQHSNSEEFSGLNQKILVLKAEQLVNLVVDKKLNGSGFAVSEWLLSVGSRTTSSHIVCYGLKKFKQLLKRNKNKQYKNAVLGPDAQKATKKAKNDQQVNISVEEIPDIFVNIQLNYGVDIIVVENELEFVLLLSQITKAIVESPLKRSQRKDVQFVHGNSVKVFDDILYVASYFVFPKVFLLLKSRFK